MHCLKRFILLLILFQLCDPLNKAVNLVKVECKKTDRNGTHNPPSTVGEYLTSFRDKSLKFLLPHLILIASMIFVVFAVFLGEYVHQKMKKN